MVAKGQQLTFQVVGNGNFSFTGNSTVAEVREDAANNLWQKFAGVSNLSFTAGGFIDNIVRAEWLTWSYDARVTVTTKEAYNTAGDVGSIVANCFYRAAGSMPTVSVVGVDQMQGAGVTSTSATIAAIGTGASSLLSSIGAALGAGVDKANTVVKGNLIIVIAGVLILAYIVAGPGGRNVGSVARAVRS